MGIHRQPDLCDGDAPGRDTKRVDGDASHGDPMPPGSYDESRELDRFLWHHCAAFATDPERRAHSNLWFERHARSAPAAIARRFLARVDHRGEVQALLRDGEGTFRQRVRERLLADRRVSVRRCSTCERVQAGPSADPCPWCSRATQELPSSRPAPRSGG